MSLTYSARASGFGFWAGALALSAGLHVALPAKMMTAPKVLDVEDIEPLGVTGAILFDLSDVVAAPAALAEDSIAQEDSQEAPTVTESPEVVEAAQAAEEPILSQIPYAVDDDSLKFNVAAPESEIETEETAKEIATEQDPEQVDVESQVGAEDSEASDYSTSGVEAEQVADKAKAQSEGLTAEQTAEIHDWQKSIVLMISEAKAYPKKARRDRITGEVLVRFTIDLYGGVTMAEVAESSGWPILDQAAVQTVMDIGKMPTPPNYLDGEEFTLLIPLRYRFR